MKTIFAYLKPYIKQCVIGPLFKLVEAVLELVLPILMAMIIDNGIDTGDKAYIYRLGGLMLLITLLGFLSALVCQYSASVASQGFGTALRSALYKKINRLSFRQADRLGASTLTNRLVNDINQLQLAVAMTIRLVVRAPFICIGSLIAAAILDLKLSIVLFVSLFVLVLFVVLVVTKSVPIYKQVQRKLDVLSRSVRENLSGVRVIRAFARTSHEKEKFTDKNNDLTATAVRVGKISTLINPFTMLIMNGAIVAVLYFGGFRVNAGGLSQGELLAFTNYIAQILSSLIIVANLVILFTKASASLNRISEVMGLEEKAVPVQPGAKDKIENAPAIEFRGVSFAYSKSGKPAIEDISFSLGRGETLGIIGGTGSGKTTLVNLLPRFYTPTDGEIFIGGVNIARYSDRELRAKFGISPQKTNLFSGTIAGNIRWGKADALPGEIKAAAEAAQAAEFIEKLPGGYDSRVERGGANLSGGQRQRIGVARALIARPEILILDDAASALDYATEARLRSALKSYSKGDMAVVIVSQRVASVMRADQILVLEDGKAAGFGRHEELLESCEIYRQIVESQLK